VAGAVQGVEEVIGEGASTITSSLACSMVVTVMVVFVVVLARVLVAGALELIVRGCLINRVQYCK
jgi:hypothetical protein